MSLVQGICSIKFNFALVKQIHYLYYVIHNTLLLAMRFSQTHISLSLVTSIWSLNKNQQLKFKEVGYKQIEQYNLALVKLVKANS